MDFQLIDVRGDVMAAYLASQGRLLEGEECCRESCHACGFKQATCLETFPGAGDLYTDS